MKRTVLYNQHIALQAKMVDFAGFEMPIQYEGIIQEHNATRNNIGLFDVSHMGKFIITGKNASDNINNLITNDMSEMSIGQAVYSPMCYESGGTVDDILVYKLRDTEYMLVVNAANIAKDYEWIESHLTGESNLEDITDTLCQIAVQGPKALELLADMTEEDLNDINYYWFKDNVSIEGINLLASRTGYTGEDGFELYAPSESAETLWQSLLEKGEAYGIKPCGLGARDTLRFEAGMPLYGNELGQKLNPIEAGLSYFVKLDKKHFVGLENLKAYKESPKRKIVGFELLDKGIARHGADVIDDNDAVIGTVTTGYKSPTFNATLGFALIPYDYKDKTITIQVRKKRLKAKIINKRFLKTYKTEV